MVSGSDTLLTAQLLGDSATILLITVKDLSDTFYDILDVTVFLSITLGSMTQELFEAVFSVYLRSHLGELQGCDSPLQE